MNMNGNFVFVCTTFAIGSHQPFLAASISASLLVALLMCALNLSIVGRINSVWLPAQPADL